MDAKALAKSKRAHSQHNSSKKQHHPNKPSKPSSSGTTVVGAATPSSKQQVRRHKSSTSQGSLPSNWDRYDEEYNDDDSVYDSVSKATDVILPKSKGADYGYLISEAKSQSSPSFDDVLHEFNPGVGTLISVKGERILSWIADNNFIVEDKSTASHEASFLSLDLHALAEKLAKADLAQRLFIDGDLLPLELCIKLEDSSRKVSGQGQAPSRSQVAEKDSNALAFCDVSETDRYFEFKSSDTTTNSSHPFQSFANKGSKSIYQVKDEPQHFGGTSQSTLLESAAELDVNSIANPNEKPSRFEALAAEAELDMLLDSETKFLYSSDVMENSNHTSYLPREERSTSLYEGISFVQLVPAQSVKKGPDLSRSTMVSTKLDDTIDDLLNETSNLINQNGTSQSHEVKASPSDVPSSSSCPPASKSKLLDDFDSWLGTI